MAEHSIQAPTTLDQDTGRALQVAMRKLRLAKGDVVVLGPQPYAIDRQPRCRLAH